MISINHVRIANIVVILISALWLYVAGLPEGIVIDCQPATSQQLKSTDRILFIMENSKISKSCKMLEFSGIWSEAKKELLHSLALLLFCIGVLFLIIDPIVFISNKITYDNAILEAKELHLSSRNKLTRCYEFARMFNIDLDVFLGLDKDTLFDTLRRLDQDFCIKAQDPIKRLGIERK